MSDSLDQEQLQPLNNGSPYAPSNAAQSPPHASPARHRPGYARATSVSFIDERVLPRVTETTMDEDITQAARNAPPSHGLGVGLGIMGPGSSSKSHQSAAQNIPRIPVGGKKTPDPQTPDPARPLLSPPSTGGFSGSTRYDETFADFDSSYIGSKHMAKQSVTSLNSMNAPSDRSLLHKSATASIREQFDEFSPRHVCNSSRRFKRGMNNWLAITIVLLSVFSTLFSGAFLFIALARPRYGRIIGTDGPLTVSSAAFLTSLFAKMIELSFITVVVSFLGQALARRAYKKETDRGVSLAEMNMRSWIQQPGTMFTHWESVKYAGISSLGILALIAAIMAMLYTSAATALVQPQLKFSKTEHRSLQSDVWASFANAPWIQKNCKTPITSLIDSDDQTVEDTCISIEHASQAYHNYQNWIATWTDTALSGNGTRDLSTRPPGWAIFNDNTTVTAPWIERQNASLWKDTGWFINNVTMAMPHSGVVSAAADPANGIMQPDELNGLGIYSIRASVPSAFVNVLCASGMSADQLSPLIYSDWNVSDKSLNVSAWPHQLSKNKTYLADPYLGGTIFDDVFQWGPNWGIDNAPPIFYKLPMNYNSIVNDTTSVAWGRTSVYVLGKGGPVDATGTATDLNYALCELRVGQTPQCSTQYNASSNVGTLEAICEDDTDDMRYIKSLSTAPQGNESLSQDWPNIASMWSRSINLNDGILDGNASNVRLWSELILTNNSIDWTTGLPALSNALPSPAEALAVMSGCTLLQSSQDAPFVEFWNYSSPSLTEGQTQWFNATVRAQQYASGGTQDYQKAFYIVLFPVFIINIFVLIYWCVHREWYVDFSDPANLFALAINSPPSEKLAECTCGDSENRGEHFRHYWKLGSDGGHVIMESPEINEMEGSPRVVKRRPISERFEMLTSPVMKAAGRWRKP